MADKSFFVDTTKCTACRGCQIACKQWNKNPGTKTIQRGTHQNPEDLSFSTFKLVRFNDFEVNGQPKWYFFADQCRHCVEPPCMYTAQSFGSKAIIRDQVTGAVLYDKKVKIKAADFKKVRESCPWDIPRWDEKTEGMAKCTMCIDRIKEGLLPACVKTCPTGAMNFGDRAKIIDMAKKRLKEVKATNPKAQLLNAETHRTIFLVIDDPKKYHKYAAENDVGITRIAAIKKLIQPFVNLSRITG
ncbi:MAG: formate dehydrogenase [Nitrospirota bacterium]|nr:formate dehydrogenase [Nitrospirota bacterium]MDH5767893.1 formate dehydrogenase [Nitrospirota bacterium]